MHYVARKCGVDYRRYCKENWACLRRAHIIATRRTDLVLDIGANRGGYVSDLRRMGYKGQTISFEPLREAFDALRRRAEGDALWHCENVAIGDVDGEIDLNVSGHETSSSVLTMAVAHLKALPEARSVKSQKVRIRRLDTALRGIPSASSTSTVYLKADVQGFEKQVIEGAVETISRIDAMELELSLAPLYEDAPQITEMMLYMERLGFSLVSFEPVFFDPVSGFVLQGDGIFVRVGMGR